MLTALNCHDTLNEHEKNVTSPWKRNNHHGSVRVGVSVDLSHAGSVGRTPLAFDPERISCRPVRRTRSVARRAVPVSVAPSTPAVFGLSCGSDLLLPGRHQPLPLRRVNSAHGGVPWADVRRSVSLIRVRGFLRSCFLEDDRVRPRGDLHAQLPATGEPHARAEYAGGFFHRQVPHARGGAARLHVSRPERVDGDGGKAGTQALPPAPR